MRRLATIVLSLGALLAASTAVAQRQALGWLTQAPKGQWTVTTHDGAFPTRKICIGNPAQLVQLGHAGSGCSRFLVEQSPNRVTVQYSCKGAGYGRTSLRRETASLIQIESQGIARGRPFQFRAEARRSGACR